MTNSTLEIEQVHSNTFHTGDKDLKIVFAASYGEVVSFSERIMIFRDGNSDNFSESNCISYKWFKKHYDYKAFLEDYSLIQRLSHEANESGLRFNKLYRESRLPKKIGDIEQQIVDLGVRDFDRLIKRISKARSAKITNRRAA